MNKSEGKKSAQSVRTIQAQDANYVVVLWDSKQDCAVAHVLSVNGQALLERLRYTMPTKEKDTKSEPIIHVNS